MKHTTFSQLRNNAKVYFDAVEKGESIQVYRRSKLIAVINPVNTENKKHWKNPAPLKLNGLELSKAILTERKLRG